MLDTFLDLFLAVAFPVELGEPSSHHIDFGHAVSERRIWFVGVFRFLFFAFSHNTFNDCLIYHTRILFYIGLSLSMLRLSLLMLIILENGWCNGVRSLNHRGLNELIHLEDFTLMNLCLAFSTF